jgi:hypothetical protein
MGLLSNLFRNMGGHHGGGHGGGHGSGHGNRGYPDDRYGNYPPPGAPAPVGGTGATVACPSCSTVNVVGARFCVQCGKPMAPGVCSTCNSSLVPGAKFCASCGKAQT